MKGIKGERKCYGMFSPLHGLLKACHLKYEGTRMSNGYYKSPWYMYGSEPGEGKADAAELVKSLQRNGWVLRADLDGNEVRYPQTGTARGGAAWESYQLEKDFPSGLHTINIVNYVYEKKPARNHVSFNQITYAKLD